MEKKIKLTLRAIRVNNNWTIKEFAEKIGVSVDTLKNYESFKTYPDIPTVEKIIEVTGIDYDNILLH